MSEPLKMNGTTYFVRLTEEHNDLANKATAKTVESIVAHYYYLPVKDIRHTRMRNLSLHENTLDIHITCISSS